MTPTQVMIDAAACALANARARRKGRPGIGSDLSLLDYDARRDVREDAEEALSAGLRNLPLSEETKS